MDTPEQQAATWRTLSQLAPAMAHDLRAPINTLSIQLAVMEESPPEANAPERQRRRLAVLREELSRLHGGLEAFFALFSGAREIQEVDLRAPVAELALLLAALGRKRRSAVEARTGERPVPVEAPPPRLRQALLAAGMAALESLAPEASLELVLEGEDEAARLVLAGGPAGAGPVDAAGELFRLAEALLSSLGARLSLLPPSPAEERVGLLIEFRLAREAGG